MEHFWPLGTSRVSQILCTCLTRPSCKELIESIRKGEIKFERWLEASCVCHYPVGQSDTLLHNSHQLHVCITELNHCQPKMNNCGPLLLSPLQNTNSIEQNCCDCSIISIILHYLQEATSCNFCLFSTGCFNRQLEAVASLVSSQLKPKECRYGVYGKLRQTENAFLWRLIWWDGWARV